MYICIMETAIQFYLHNNITLEKVCKKFNLNRKTFTKYLKQFYPNYKTIQFKNVANKLHNYKYDYSLVNTLSRKKDVVQIICPIHGVFDKDIYNHINNKVGCKQCSIERAAKARTNDTAYFINFARKVHGDKYDYSKSCYINNVTKLIITCPIHGDFEQGPDQHTQGKGCMACSIENRGWTKTKWKKKGKGRKAKVYIIKCYNQKESFLKIGRTFNSVKRRFAWKQDMPYKYEIIHIVESQDYDEIWDLEVMLHRKFKKQRYLPQIHFDGSTECFNISILKELKTALEITN